MAIITGRECLEWAVALGFLPALGGERFIVASARAEKQAVFKLPDLGYPFEELEPHIDSQTLHLHHDRHHAAAVTRLGSGWAWLVVDRKGEPQAISTQNQDTPLEQGARRVVLAVDVWEHAYYLKYQDKRSDYLTAWWNAVNWDNAASNFAKAPARSPNLHKRRAGRGATSPARRKYSDVRHLGPRQNKTFLDQDYASAWR